MTSHGIDDLEWPIALRTWPIFLFMWPTRTRPKILPNGRKNIRLTCMWPFSVFRWPLLKDVIWNSLNSYSKQLIFGSGRVLCRLPIRLFVEDCWNFSSQGKLNHLSFTRTIPHSQWPSINDLPAHSDAFRIYDTQSVSYRDVFDDLEGHPRCGCAKANRKRGGGERCRGSNSKKPRVTGLTIRFLFPSSLSGSYLHWMSKNDLANATYAFILDYKVGFFRRGKTKAFKFFTWGKMKVILNVGFHENI